MSRYAVHSQEILYDSMGRIAGFNAGYGFYSEHEWGYQGRELANPADHSRHAGSGSFADCLVDKPDHVMLVERDDGMAGITNDARFANRFDFASSSEWDEYMSGNRDVSEYGSYGRQPGIFDAFWDSSRFTVFGKTDEASDAIREVYEATQGGDVAIAANFSPLFSDRGLSFVILSRLDDEATDSRATEVKVDRAMSEGERALNEWLVENGNPRWQYPKAEGAIWLSNVQANHCIDIDDELVVYYYFEPHDMPAWVPEPDNIDSVHIRRDNVSNCLTREAIEEIARISFDEDYNCAEMWDVDPDTRLHFFERKLLVDSGIDFDVADWRKARKIYEDGVMR